MNLSLYLHDTDYNIIYRKLYNTLGIKIRVLCNIRIMITYVFSMDTIYKNVFYFSISIYMHYILAICFSVIT